MRKVAVTVEIELDVEDDAAAQKVCEQIAARAGQEFRWMDKVVRVAQGVVRLVPHGEMSWDVKDPDAH